MNDAGEPVIPVHKLLTLFELGDKRLMSREEEDMFHMFLTNNPSLEATLPIIFDFIDKKYPLNSADDSCDNSFDSSVLIPSSDSDDEDEIYTDPVPDRENARSTISQKLHDLQRDNEYLSQMLLDADINKEDAEKKLGSLETELSLLIKDLWKKDVRNNSLSLIFLELTMLFRLKTSPTNVC